MKRLKWRKEEEKPSETALWISNRYFLLDVMFLCWTSQKVEVHSHEGKHEQHGHRCRQTAGHSEAAVWSRRPGEHICLCCRLCVLSIDVWLCVCSRVLCGSISTLKYCNPYRCGSLGSPRLHVCCCEEFIIIFFKVLLLFWLDYLYSC